jgi:hypothetical protein
VVFRPIGCDGDKPAERADVDQGFDPLHGRSKLIAKGLFRNGWVAVKGSGAWTGGEGFADAGQPTIASRLFGWLFLLAQQSDQVRHAGIIVVALAFRRRRRPVFPAQSLDQSKNHGRSIE